MKPILKRAALLAPIAGVMLLAGCASPAPDTRVTRFHLGQPIAPGQVAVEPRDPTLAGDLEFRSQADAVGRELTRLGYTVSPGLARSELVAVVEVNRGTREQLNSGGSGVSVGLGGGGFSGGRGGGGIGLGGGVSFPIGRSRGRYVTMTEMAVQLKRRSEGTVIWEGRAETAARDGTPDASPQAAVAKLAQALFQDFPGESGRTISVK